MPSITLIDPDSSIAPISIQKDHVTLDTLRVNYADVQTDSEAIIEFRNVGGNFVIGGNEGAYVAILRVPPKQYDADHKPLPIDHCTVSIQLWPFEG